MHTIKLKNNHSVTLYDSIHELPQSRRNEVHKATLIRQHIGNDASGYPMHLEQLNQLVANMLINARRSKKVDSVFEDGEKVLQEIKNLNIHYTEIVNKTDFKSHEFHAYIYKIDNEEIVRFDDEYVNEVSIKLEKYGLKSGMVSNALNDIKKNLIPN